MLALAHQNLLILGLGDSGLAMARWGVFCGATVWVADNRQEPPQLQALRQEVPQAQFVSASLDEQLLALARFDGVYKSPGLSPQSVHALWLEAQSQGLKTGNELSLFAQALNDLKARAQYQPDVLVVTGTNGKTTVTSLCAQMLQKAKKRVAVAGNIGPTLLGTLLTYLTPADLAALRERPMVGLEPSRVGQIMAVGESLGDVAPVPATTELDESVHAHSPEAIEDDEELSLEHDACADDATSDTPDAAPDATRPTLALSHPGSSVVASEPVLDAWQSELAWPEVWVLEISSFQAHALTDFEPTAAVILNITEDHLDWHADMQAYRAAKVGLFAAHTCRIIHRGDPDIWDLRPSLSAQAALLKPNSALARAAREALPRWVSYAADVPERAGDFGLEHSGGMVWLVRCPEAEVGVKLDASSTQAVPVLRLMPLDALKIRGPHNALNALAALALASTTRAHMAPLLHALKDYGGEPHRIQTLRVLDGVQYVDDSKGTNVAATCAALRALGQDGPVVGILGGVGKGQDFSPLLGPVAQYVRAVILMGEDAPLIQQVLAPLGKPMVTVQSMAQAVSVAQEWARAGDAVLLSPACASFDMFKDYEHRAQVFQEAVNHLSASASAPAPELAPQPQLTQEAHHG
jgi:UDP-N-acetylmuramoylalanine--D-glutamate ligase